MPIPLVELIKVDSVLEIVNNKIEERPKLFEADFKKYQQIIWEKENKMLQNLVQLPSNYLPKNKTKTASYEEIKPTWFIKTKLEDDDRKSSHSTNKQTLGSQELRSEQS